MAIISAQHIDDVLNMHAAAWPTAVPFENLWQRKMDSDHESGTNRQHSARFGECKCLYAWWDPAACGNGEKRAIPGQIRGCHNTFRVVEISVSRLRGSIGPKG